MVMFFGVYFVTTHSTWSHLGTSVPFYIYKSPIYSSGQNPFLNIQSCISHRLWDSYFNVVETLQPNRLNLNSSPFSCYPYSSIFLLLCCSPSHQMASPFHSTGQLASTSHTTSNQSPSPADSLHRHLHLVCPSWQPPLESRLITTLLVLHWLPENIV